VSASTPPGVALPVFSSPSACSGSVANASSSKEQLLGQSRRTQGYNKQQDSPFKANYNKLTTLKDTNISSPASASVQMVSKSFQKYYRKTDLDFWMRI
jgi:hypothetical protein